MAIQRSVLLIADIGGYTRFMKEHRFALAHAQDAVARLLEAVLDAAKPLKLAKLEGDAAFLYAPLKSLDELARLAEILSNIRRGFLARQRDLVVNQACTCKGCDEVGKLTLKFVAHAGEVAFQKVKRLTELAGVDVILLHRMLKNDVPVPEYVLMTDPVLERFDASLARHAETLEHDFEGLGRTRTHYIDLQRSEAHFPEPAPQPWIRLRLRQLALAWRSLPYWLGLRTPCANFRNLESESEPLPALPPAS